MWLVFLSNERLFYFGCSNSDAGQSTLLCLVRRVRSTKESGHDSQGLCFDLVLGHFTVTFE